MSASSRLRLALAVFIAILLGGALGLAVTRDVDNPSATSGLALIGGNPIGAAFGAEAGELAQAPVAPSLPETTTTTTTRRVPVPPGTGYIKPMPTPPDPMPANPYAATPQVVLGKIEIPKLGVVGDLQEGITLTAINRGPGHWPGTPMPGGQGNMVIAGHRTTYSKPFANLDQLVPGDQVIFRMASGMVTYLVRGVIIVPAANIGIAAQSFAHTATLFACHPRGSATHRLVAKLALLGPDGKPVDKEADMPPVEQGSNPVTDTTLMVRATGEPSTPGGDPFAGSGG